MAEEEIVLFWVSVSRDISVKAGMFFVGKSFTEIKIVYQKYFRRIFYQLHASALDVLFEFKSHIQVSVPELTCRLAC